MKVKIKDPATLFGARSWIAYLYIFIFMLALSPLMWEKGSFSWAAYNQLALEICEGRGMICFFAFKIFPWLALALVGLTIYRIYTIFFSPKRPKNKIRTVEFLPEGVQLAYTKQTQPLLLPYLETQFILEAYCSSAHNRYGSFAVVNFCTLSFLHGNKKFSCKHAVMKDIPLLTALVEKGNAFKKFTLKIEPLTNGENHAAKEIRTILEDYRKYGLMCRLNETDRETIFGFSCIFMAFSVAAGYMLYQLKHWLPIACLAVFLPAGLLFIYRWHQDNQIAKQLARLKGKK